MWCSFPTNSDGFLFDLYIDISICVSVFLYEKVILREFVRHIQVIHDASMELQQNDWFQVELQGFLWIYELDVYLFRY